jgi:transcriptional regulator with XRE-family HTH domain
VTKTVSFVTNGFFILPDKRGGGLQDFQCHYYFGRVSTVTCINSCLIFYDTNIRLKIHITNSKKNFINILYLMLSKVYNYFINKWRLINMKNNLKQIRKVKGVTQQQLADNLGVSKAMVSMWENNPKENIPQPRIKQICDFLKIEEHLLFAKELNIHQLKRSAEEEEFLKMLENFAERNEIEQLQRVKAVGELNESIAEDLSNMEDQPDNLNKVKRFLRIVNNEEIEKLFDQNIYPFALDIFNERILNLVEEKNPSKLKTLFIILEYFVLLTPENKLEKTKVSISENKDFLLRLDDLLNEGID